MQAKKFTRVLLTGTFVIALSGSAFALDGSNFVKTLNGAIVTTGGKITADKVDVSGDTVVLHGAKMEMPGADSIGIGDMTYAGVQKSDDGGYTVDKLTLPDVDRKKRGAEITLKNIHAEGLRIPPAGGDGNALPYITYKTAGGGPLTVSDKRGEIISIADISMNLSPMDGDAGYESKMSATGLAFHVDHLTPKARRAAEAIGYDVINGRIAADGSWEADSGHVSVSHIALQLDNVGTLTTSFDFDGYTPAFIKQMRELGEKARAKPDDPAVKQALGIGMLGLIQQLKFGGASLRFDDDSVTGKALAYAGKQQGTTGEQMAKAAEAMLPMMLGKLQNPQFQQKIVDAVSAFLDDPKNIEIKAAPESPIAFPMIMGAAMSSPQTLPDVLNVDVKANR